MSAVVYVSIDGETLKKCMRSLLKSGNVTECYMLLRKYVEEKHKDVPFLARDAIVSQLKQLDIDHLDYLFNEHGIDFYLEELLLPHYKATGQLDKYTGILQEVALNKARMFNDLLYDFSFENPDENAFQSRLYEILNEVLSDPASCDSEVILKQLDDLLSEVGNFVELRMETD